MKNQKTINDLLKVSVSYAYLSGQAVSININSKARDLVKSLADSTGAIEAIRVSENRWTLSYELEVDNYAMGDSYTEIEQVDIVFDQNSIRAASIHCREVTLTDLEGHISDALRDGFTSITVHSLAS